MLRAAPDAPAMAEIHPRARPPRQPTQARAKVKVRAILDAADRLLRGSSSSSVEAALVMRDVARRAGVKPATLYDYFPTKELLLRALEDRAWRSAAERVRTVIQTTRDAPLARDAIAFGALTQDSSLRSSIGAIVEMFMTEMADAARTYGRLTPESPFGFDSREIIGAELAALATAALEGRTVDYAMRDADLRLRLRIATETVALLIWVAARDHAAALEDGSYAREVGRLIAHYLVRD